MSAALLVGAVILAVVFATAGVTKLFDLEGSRRAVAAFGVPQRLAPGLGTLLPLAELATAALLIVGAAYGGGALLAGALSALALLAIFCAGIALSLARGRAPDCHCFGQLHSAPASGRTLVRNGALLTVAAFVASGGDPTPTAAAGIAAALTLVPRRRSGPMRSEPPAPEGLPLGTRAPAFELPALDGPPLSLAGLLQRGRPMLLVFTDPDCGPCIALAPQVAAWQRDLAGDVTIAVIENGDRRSAAPDEHGRRDVLLQRDGQVASAYRAEGTPSAVLVATDGRIASGVAPGGAAIEALLARTVHRFDRLTSEPAAPPRARLVRREFLARAAAAWASVTGLVTPSAWAGRQVTLDCRYERCGDRCCPKKAKCRRRGGRRVCVCPDGRRACGDRCCPQTFVCRRRGRRRRRRCLCPDGYVVCSGRCVRPRTDPRHCGRCGRVCPRGTSCVDGQCVGGDGSGTGPDGSGACDCPPGKACCEGQCTDLNTTEAHCGECGQTCAEGKTCCEGNCRNLENDPRNCGECGKRCAGDEACSDGECRRRCPRGQRNCGGSCVDPSSDRNNCGRCGTNCGEGYACCAGSCCSYNASTCCPSGCVNTAFDHENCGGCGIVCGPNSYCRFGTCTCVGSPCP